MTVIVTSTYKAHPGKARLLLSNMKEIDFIKFNDVDVVRHSLVRKIARAYEKNLDTKRKL